MEQISETRLAVVHPALADKVRAMVAAMESQGIEVRVVQGLRSVEDQNVLYAQGRSAPGAKVTMARGGESWHNFGLAVDCVPGIRGKNPWQPNWDARHADFMAMIALCEAQGLVAGARWKTLPDAPHFQLARIPVSPDDVARGYLAKLGLHGFWSE